jgi:hypothetical protein
MAHRNQKNRRLKKKKNKTRKPLSVGMARLVQRLPNLNLPAQEKVLINPPEHEKMSEVILDFAQPLLDMSDNDEATQKAIDFAIVAWNFAIIKERSGEQALEEMMRKTAKPGTDEAMIERYKPHFDMLFQRKRELFPDNQRMILDYEFTESRDKFHLNVLSYSAP